MSAAIVIIVTAAAFVLSSLIPESPEEQESPDDLIARAETDARTVLAAELLEKIRLVKAARDRGINL